LGKGKGKRGGRTVSDVLQAVSQRLDFHYYLLRPFGTFLWGRGTWGGGKERVEGGGEHNGAQGAHRALLKSIGNEGGNFLKKGVGMQSVTSKGCRFFGMAVRKGEGDGAI